MTKKIIEDTKIIEIKKVDYTRSLGRRKSAVARVRIKEGTGKIVVNGKPYQEYFPYFDWQRIILLPLKLLGKEKFFDVSIKTIGGGKKGQAEAIKLGIARALLKYNEEWRKTLKSNSFLSRDSRTKERKKFGLKKARKAPQWSKR
jgi:small subunit ribosomal protein S9